MKVLNLATLVLVILGGVNWGLLGAADYNLVAEAVGESETAIRVFYAVVGLAALWQIVPFVAASRMRRELPPPG